MAEAAEAALQVGARGYVQRSWSSSMTAAEAEGAGGGRREGLPSCGGGGGARTAADPPD